MAVSRISLARAVIFAIIVVGLGYVAYTYKTRGGLFNKNYQAVFLTNGQVYFGKITNRNGLTTSLKDIYYLQVQQPIQPTPEGQKTDAASQTQVQLVKLGGELHKPKDEMIINNQQILFTEEVQDDGQVGQAIARHKSGADQQPAQTQTPTTTPTSKN